MISNPRNSTIRSLAEPITIAADRGEQVQRVDLGAVEVLAAQVVVGDERDQHDRTGDRDGDDHREHVEAQARRRPACVAPSSVMSSHRKKHRIIAASPAAAVNNAYR